MQMLPMMKPCFPPPQADFASLPAHSLSSPSAPVAHIRYKAGFNPSQWSVGRGAGAAPHSQALPSELLITARGWSQPRGSGVPALRLHSFAPKIHSSQLHIPSDIAKYTVPSPARSTSFFKYSSTPVFLPLFKERK